MSEPLSENEIEIINRWRLRAQNEYCDQPSAEEDALEEKLAIMIEGHSANTGPTPVMDAAPAWQPIETAPKGDCVSFLVLRPYSDMNVVIQVSRFEGRMYPDANDCCIDWGDGITNAIGWQPLSEDTRTAGESDS